MHGLWIHTNQIQVLALPCVGVSYLSDPGPWANIHPSVPQLYNEDNNNNI